MRNSVRHDIGRHDRSAHGTPRGQESGEKHHRERHSGQGEAEVRPHQVASGTGVILSEETKAGRQGEERDGDHHARPPGFDQPTMPSRKHHEQAVHWWCQIDVGEVVLEGPGFASFSRAHALAACGNAARSLRQIRHSRDTPSASLLCGRGRPPPALASQSPVTARARSLGATSRARSGTRRVR